MCTNQSHVVCSRTLSIPTTMTCGILPCDLSRVPTSNEELLLLLEWLLELLSRSAHHTCGRVKRSQPFISHAFRVVLFTFSQDSHFRSCIITPSHKTNKATADIDRLAATKTRTKVPILSPNLPRAHGEASMCARYIFRCS